MTTSRNVVLQLARPDSGTVAVTFSIDGVTNLSATDLSGLYLSFDEVLIGIGNLTAGRDFRVDNIDVDTGAISSPEPDPQVLAGLLILTHLSMRVR
jgi:hypothetical protein